MQRIHLVDKNHGKQTIDFNSVNIRLGMPEDRNENSSLDANQYL